ncbi:unnamed protein product [Rotaria socialis]|uniref:G-protein coupled receptors family 1 profile domain-containing protein n=1 Tax=Rotaria socialis TaxID=392032 RepID=A0A817T9D2_9BILA|nr:unnamed protein product [Rotaria socialis]CAF3305226.1 unnamed protein product [Rotaria socialis]CAF3357253.1 unnamed protein product [Rotaria socialis]CAF4366214.1 unnamed protein product [Rotaria socialis]CAF4733115.1 unnamed protein product [Rotaria socialis]
MADNITTTTASTVSIGGIPLSTSIRFGLLIGSEIPSLVCSLFVLYNFIFDPALIRSLPHHTIICLNITGTLFKCIDVPLYLNYTIMGEVWPPTAAVCLVWWLADYGFYNACVVFTAWISIERHIFIYHNHWLSTPRKRFFVHYLPLFLIIVYLLVFYVWVIFFPPCENIYDYTLSTCGATPCYILQPIPGIWDAAVNGCLMAAIIVVFSIGLVIRVLMGKCRHHQAMHWRQHRKMTLQLVSISSIFIIFGLPSAIVTFIQLCGIPFDEGNILLPYFFFTSYWLIFLIPFVCLHSLPNVKQRIMKILCISPRQQATVGVTIMTAPRHTTRM